LEETRSTLQFAARAKLVKTRAQVNEILDDRAIIKRLQRELVEARRHAAAVSTEGVTVMNTENVEKLKFLEEQVDTTKDAFAKAMKNVERLKGLFLRSGDFETSNSSENIQRSKQASTARERRRKTIDNNDITAQEAFVVDSNLFLKQDELLRVKRGNRRQSDGGVLPSYSSYKQNSLEDHVNENIDQMIFKEALAQKGDLSRKLHARKQESDALVSDLCEQVENLKGKHDTLIQRNNFVEAQIVALEADRDVVVKDKCEQIEKLTMELNKYKEYLLEEKKVKESTLSDLDDLRKETSVRISDNALMEEELCRLEIENTEQNTTIRKLQSNVQSRDEMIESLRIELSNQQEQNRSSLALMNDEILKQKGCNDELLSVKEKELSNCKDNLMALQVKNENLQNILNDYKIKWEVEKSEKFSLQENLKLKDAQMVSEKDELALKLLNFEQQMEEQKSENERLTKNITDLTTENEKGREELRLRTDEKYSLEEDLQAKIKESSEQRHRFDQMSESLSESSAEIHGLKEKARQLTAEIERLSTEILNNEQEFLTKNLERETKCTDLNEQLAASITSSSEDHEKFLVEIKRLKETIDENSDERRLLQAEFQAKNNESCKEKRNYEMDLLKLKEDLEERAILINDLEDGVSKLVQEQADLTDQLRESQGDLAKRSAEIETLKNEKTNAEGELHFKIEKSESQINRLTEEIDSLQRCLSEQTMRKEVLSKKLSDAVCWGQDLQNQMRLNKEKEFADRFSLKETLEAKIMASTNERDTYRQELVELREKFDEHSNEMTKLQNELKVKISESTDEHKKFEEEISQLKQNLDKTTVQNEKFEIEIEGLQAEMATLVNDLRVSQDSLKEASSEKSRNSENCVRLEEQLQTTISDFSDKREKFEVEISQLKEKLEEGSSTIESLRAEVSEHSAEVETLKTQSANLINDLRVSQDCLKAASSEKSSIEQELLIKISDGEDKCIKLEEELKVKISQSIDEREKFEVEMSQLKEKLEEGSSTIESLRSEAIERSDEIEKLSAQTANLASDLQVSQDCLKMASSEKSNIEQELLMKISGSEETCINLEEQLQTKDLQLSNEREKFEVEISQLKEKLEEGSSTIESLRAEVSERSVEIETLRTQSANLENDLRVSQDCLKAASSEKSSIEQELLIKISDGEDKCIKLEEEFQAKISESIDEREKFEVEMSQLKEKLEEGSSTIESLRSEAIERSDEIDELNAKVTNLAKDLQKSQDCLKAVSSEKSNIERELLTKISGSDEQLQTKDLELSTEREKFEVEISQLKEKLEEGTSTIECLRSEAIEHSTEMEGLKLKILRYNEELEKLREELGHQSTENCNLLSVISNVSNEREELEKKIRSLNSTLEGKASLEVEILEKSSNAEDRYNKLEDDFARVQERLLEETAKNSTLSSRVADIENVREVSKEHIAAMGNDMEDVKSQLSEAVNDRVKIKENLNVQEALKDQALCKLKEEIRKNSVMQSEVTKLERELLCVLEKINKNDNEFPQYDEKVKYFQASIHEKDVHIATLEEKFKAQDQSYAQTLSTANKHLKEKETEVEKLSNAFNKISEEKSSVINELQEQLDLAKKSCANAEANYFDAKQGYEDVVDENSILRSKLDAAGIKQSEVVSAISIENEGLKENLEGMKNEISSAISEKEEMESYISSLRTEIQDLRQKYKFAETQAAEACRDAKFHKNEVCLRNRLARDQEEELKDGKIIYNELLQELNELKNAEISEITTLRDEICKLNEIIKVKDARIKKLDATKLTSAQATVSKLILFMYRNFSLT